MLIVRNVGLRNLRISVSLTERYLIVAGGAPVELPDSVKKDSFFNELVESGEVVIDKDEKGRSTKVKTSA